MTANPSGRDGFILVVRDTRGMRKKGEKRESESRRGGSREGGRRHSGIYVQSKHSRHHNYHKKF
jgi:hypothetical protein